MLRLNRPCRWLPVTRSAMFSSQPVPIGGIAELPPDKKPTKLVYRDKTYYLKPRPGKTPFQEEFPMELVDMLHREGFIDYAGRPKYRSLKYFFVKDMEWEMKHKKAWQYCAQMNEGHQPVYDLGKYDKVTYALSKIAMLLLVYNIIYCSFWLICPEQSNPFIWHGDDNQYMSFRDWLLGNKLKKHDDH